jgi:hypothetical protein
MSPIERVGITESDKRPTIFFNDAWADIVFLLQAVVIVYHAVKVPLQCMAVISNCLQLLSVNLGAAAGLMGTI